MTVYFNFYDTSEMGEYNVPHESTSDNNKLTVRRGIVDFAKQSVAATQVANAIKLYTGEIVHDVMCRVITAESTSNGAVDVGFNGSAAVAADFDIETANNFNANVTLVPTYFAADNAITLTPNNAAACNTGKVEVMAIITKSLFA
jgi:hypothetical protein